jgi:hypothetical protein
MKWDASLPHEYDALGKEFENIKRKFLAEIDSIFMSIKITEV